MRWKLRLKIADAEVRRVMDALPGDVGALAQSIPICFETRPPPSLAKDGWSADLLGLFVGSPYSFCMEESDALPPQILLYLDNLWEFAQERPEVYREEVRTTYLHELGHYLGFEEQDLAERDLM